MEKNKKTIISWSVTGFAALCGLTAFFMIFVRAINTPYSLSESFTGLQVALGCTTSNGFTVFRSSAGLIVAFIFPLIAACVAVIGKGYKIVAIIAAVFMVAGGVLALCAYYLFNPAITLISYSVAAGPIASGVLSLVGGATLCASLFLKN